jgi:hypothetical protein
MIFINGLGVFSGRVFDGRTTLNFLIKAKIAGINALVLKKCAL